MIYSEQTSCFSSIIKESGIDWAINISKQLEDESDLRKSNSFISKSPLSNFEEITFNMQKCKSKQLTKLIPHDSNYYLQPLSNPDIKSSNDNVFTNNELFSSSEHNLIDNNSQKHSNFLPT